MSSFRHADDNQVQDVARRYRGRLRLYRPEQIAGVDIGAPKACGWLAAVPCRAVRIHSMFARQRTHHTSWPTSWELESRVSAVSAGLFCCVSLDSTRHTSIFLSPPCPTHVAPPPSNVFMVCASPISRQPSHQVMQYLHASHEYRVHDNLLPFH